MTYIRQAEMAQEIAELMAENARLRAKLRKALGMGGNGPPFFWLGADAEPPRVTLPPPPPMFASLEPTP